MKPIGRIVTLALVALMIACCAGLAPSAAARMPTRIASYMDGEGAVFTAGVWRRGADQVSPTAALASVRELETLEGFRGRPEQPIYGVLTCPGVPECPRWFGGPGPTTIWFVWFPDSEAFVFVDARTGQMLRAGVTIRGSGEWSVVL